MVERGGHRHHNTTQAAVCIQGECKIYCSNGRTEEIFHLNSADKCLLINPEDWHTMFEFSKDSISENYRKLNSVILMEQEQMEK